VLVHGRGATARSIVQMGQQFHTDGLALLAPQAASNTWYPNPFTALVERNEPGRTSGLGVIESAIEQANDAGIPTENVLVLGFSQGAYRNRTANNRPNSPQPHAPCGGSSKGGYVSRDKPRIHTCRATGRHAGR